MSLFLLGLNHKTAPVAIRERFVLSSAKTSEALQKLRERGAREVVILSTCNRHEVYALGDQNFHAQMTPFLSEFFDVEPTELRGHLYDLGDESAARHLFEVACGVDSLVLGESQILGQVKSAFEYSQQHGAISGTLDELFRRAISCGKRARHETDIGRGALSVGSAAVELAKQIFGSLSGRTVLIIGAGKMSELTAQHLVSSGAKRIIVSNRTHERACAMARQFGEIEADRVLAEAVTWDEFPARLQEADIVISSTRAPHTVISAAQVSSAMKARRSKPLLLVDIAVPRDIDPLSHQLDNVFLYDIDDLQGVVRENRAQRESEIARVENIIGDETSNWSKWLQSLQARPVMAALAQRASQISRDEVEATLSRLPSLSEREQEIVRAMANSIAKKLINAPLQHLRSVEEGDSRDVETLRRAFDLPEENGEKRNSDGRNGGAD